MLYDLYKTQASPETCFTNLVNIAGKKYPYISYLFFLKDHSKYVPIAPSHFDRAFEKLAVPLKMSYKCSWENYSQFLSVLRQIQFGLKGEGISDISLLDAHSFCWMISYDEISQPEIRPALQSYPLEIDHDAQIAPIRAYSPVSDEKYTPKDHVNKMIENKVIGDRAEEIVLNSEKDRLLKVKSLNLADRVEKSVR